jgi:hypothetical protein
MKYQPARLTRIIRRTVLVLAASAGLATVAETATAGLALTNHTEPFARALG